VGKGLRREDPLPFFRLRQGALPAVLEGKAVFVLKEHESPDALRRGHHENVLRGKPLPPERLWRQGPLQGPEEVAGLLHGVGEAEDPAGDRPGLEDAVGGAPLGEHLQGKEDGNPFGKPPEEAEVQRPHLPEPVHHHEVGPGEEAQGGF